MDFIFPKIMIKKLKIGTRNSKLAIWQTEFVAEKLKKAGFDTEIYGIETKGDKILDQSFNKIGSKGLFTEDLERMLLDGTVDLAVHSAKDLPSELPKGLKIIAFTQREQVNDVLISLKKDVSLSQNLIVGTSSTRRIATLKHYYPHIQTVEMRGNLQTRFSKLEKGACDAILLAYAGVHRLNYDAYIAEHLSVDIFTPAVGQGSLAIEIAESLDSNLQHTLQQLLNDPQTAYALKAERSFLKTIEGGCSIPTFALATLQAEKLVMQAGIISLDGSQMIRKTLSGDAQNAEHIGQELAKEVLEAGGKEILATLK